LIDLLLSHPAIGVQTDDPTIRRINTSPYPYLIFYEIAGDEIIIHAIRHGARDPSSMPGAT
jgi:toxin ParE1/3/4